MYSFIYLLRSTCEKGKNSNMEGCNFFWNLNGVTSEIHYISFKKLQSNEHADWTFTSVFVQEQFPSKLIINWGIVGLLWDMSLSLPTQFLQINTTQLFSYKSGGYAAVVNTSSLNNLKFITILNCIWRFLV